MKSLTLREVTFGSPEFWQTTVLRDAVLRRPLGLTLSRRECEEEGGQWHVAAFREERLVGCLVLVPLPGGELKMRQVAVSPESQRAGVGTALVRHAESLAIERGYGCTVLHARAEVVPFYVRLGYVPEGAPFEEVGIEHQRMRKPL